MEVVHLALIVEQKQLCCGAFFDQCSWPLTYFKIEWTSGYSTDFGGVSMKAPIGNTRRVQARFINNCFQGSVMRPFPGS